MKTPDLFPLLNSLDNKEWKELLVFALQYHRKGSDPMRLLKLLHENRKKFPTPENIRKSEFFKSTLRNVQNKLSQLKGTVEKFIVWKQIEKDHDTLDLYLYKGLVKRGLRKEAFKQFEKCLNNYNSKLSYSINNHLLIHLLLDTAYFSMSDFKSVYGRNLVEQSKNLLSKYGALIEQKHKIETYFLEQNKNDKLNFKFQNIVIGSDDKESENLEFGYSELMSLIQTYDHRKFIALKERILLWPKNRISDTFLLIYQRLLNLATYKYSEGNSSFAEYIVEIYEMGLAKGIYETNGYLQGSLFCTIIQNLAALEKFEVADDVITNYKHKIQRNEKDITLKLALADIALNKYDFKNVQDTLSGIDPEPMWMKLKFRWIKILYLLTQSRFSEELFSFERNCYMYFYNNENKMSPRNFEMSKNLLQVIRWLYRDDPRQKIEKFIVDSPNIAMKTWLEKYIKKGLPN